MPSPEFILTAAQSLFAVAILVSLSMSRWEAAALFGFFSAQFFFTNGDVRIAFGILYCVLALGIFLRSGPYFRNFFSAARESLQRPTAGPAPPT